MAQHLPRHHSHAPMRSRSVSSRSRSTSYERLPSDENRSHQQTFSTPQKAQSQKSNHTRRRSYSGQKSSQSASRSRQRQLTQSQSGTSSVASSSIASSHRRRATADSFSVVSGPSVSSYREFREPANSKPTVSTKKVVRDQSPSSSRRSPTDKSVKSTKITRKLIEGEF